jgi:glyceraldehyde 3-phosphate dehydrogenase
LSSSKRSNLVTENTRPIPADFFADWKEREALSEAMIPLVGKLYREKNISLYIHGKNMVNRSVIEIMKAHRFVRQIEQNELSEYETFPLIEALVNMDLGPAHIDIGKLAVTYQESAGTVKLVDFLESEMADLLGSTRKPILEPQDVVLYGFGRIGRLLARLLIEKSGSGDMLRLRAVVVRDGGTDNDLSKRASLLRRDSIHGAFDGTIRVLEDKNILVCNGNPIQVIYADSPDQVDYTKFGINNAIVIDNTGVWRDEEGLGQHLACPGAAKVILTAPGKGVIPNIVYGINSHQITKNSKIISAASCTTNAIVPILKALQDEYGIIRGHVETVHSYTNDQNLIDNYHKGSRRGRSAALNMVITETGAVKAVAKALPELEGKLTGNSIRVPTPNVSMAILNLQLKRDTSREEINAYVRKMSLYSPLQNQIDYTMSTEAVSTDFVGSRHACIYDAQAAIVDGSNVVLYCWYDNEFGYSCQVIRCLEQLAGISWPMFPR